ncbi:hypothetical protein CLV62_13514 [Dysgonomonas alginatilytica]|uniref:Uncharacterized protein n=1 Tax=Dysgonomonas alginatilytica TaxID=1605892 RepID=A0A2V3PJF6_9BACT|nr:hypothetical protein [Dysgonomonas alginatilytica]PXV59442.1 hypothetical protein CLV62_13514 [Dysgonomonas alginatilytica]
MKNLFRLLFGKRKPIVLELERYFPESHKRSGQPTHFGSKILSGAKSKIHALRLNHDQWNQLNGNSGKAPLRIVYRSLRDMKISTTLIHECKKMGLQQAVIPHCEEHLILVDGKEIPIEDFVRHEGLCEDDFREWYKNDGGKQAVVIHFTDFRY